MLTKGRREPIGGWARDTKPEARRLAWRYVADPVAIFAVVTAIVLLRQAPILNGFVGVEPHGFWEPIATMDPHVYVVQLWAGYLSVWARVAFLIAYPFGEAGPFVTRLLAAVVVGAVAAFVASDRMAPAIPGRRVRAAFAMSLGLLPIVGPYVGPLNSQWWIAIAVVVLAAVPARRYDVPLLLAAGFTGIAPCFALPLYRGWRFVALAIPTVVQLALVITTDPVPRQPHIEPSFVVAGIVLALASVARSDLPIRTRVAFVVVGFGWMVAGSLRITLGPDRYEAAAWAGIALGLIAAVAWVATGRRRGADAARIRTQAEAGG